MRRRIGRSHIVIPDCQTRPGVPIDHLTWIGRYIAAKRPDVVICIGDFADMPSLNSYAVGKAESEGNRYVNDVAFTKAAMNKLTAPFAKIRGYQPEMHLTLGNHEERIDREAESNPKLIGTISSQDLGYEDFGWRVHPFLRVATIDRIEYSHFMVTGVMGRPASSAAAMLRQRMSSCVMGHVQKIDLAIHPATQYIGLFSGLCALHDEKYLGPQGNSVKRGIWVLNQVENGTCDPMFVSLRWLRENYGGR